MEETQNNQVTQLSTLGEFALIDRLTKDIKIYNAGTVKGIGDDAAVISNEEETLVSVDILVEGVHFDMTYTPLKHLGYKAAVVNFSDIYAMNGTPTHVVLALGLSSRYSVEAVEEFYSGFRLACDRYHVDLVGGDTTASKAGLFISVTVIGKAKKMILYIVTARNRMTCYVSAVTSAPLMPDCLFSNVRRLLSWLTLICSRNCMVMIISLNAS